MSFKKRCTISSSYEFQARTSSVPKEDDVFPRMLYCDSRCSQMLPGLSPALPGALLCNTTRRLGDGKRVILCQRVWGSVRAVRAVRNTLVFQTETRVVADVASMYLCIYIATHLHTAFLDWLQAVRESNSRCAWKWRSGEFRDILRGFDGARLEMHLEVEIERIWRYTRRPWLSELREALQDCDRASL